MQSRLESGVEASLNIGSGMLISWVLTLYVLPLYGLPVSHRQAFEITIVYTVVSMLRSYTWRRWFNHRTLRRFGHLLEED